MANQVLARSRQAPRKPNKAALRQQKRKRGHDDLQKIEAAIADLDPKAGTMKSFADISSSLSSSTSSGLQASHFTTMTDIQQQAIPLGLKGHDILGAAKTGSGKTLAFLVPVLEKLHRAQWTELDGLGALILSPTRELAVQIFEVLRKIGRHHPFSAGLVIGGKSLKEEAERLDRMNILVCTPGRMLQHLDQTAGFDANNLQILVLDEADRIMDLGFKAAVDALVEHLPRERQTLMFSATQSKKVSDLARLSLKDPSYVSVHQDASAATPTSLQQHYIVTPLPEKLDTLYGFLKANVKSKIIVFLSSGKQVRFVYESFRHLQPGIPLLHLHGRQKQVARLEITSRFAAAKQACLFATDVVARGIDFPAVDWVIQADCPEDADTYIHRVGRTARYESNGRAVLFLDPSEEDGMLQRLQQRRIPIARVNVKEKKKKSVRDSLQNMCFQFPDLKYLGQKAFISYTRSIYLQRDKEVFRFEKLDLDAFAASLGLPGTPQIKLGKGGSSSEDVKRIKNAPRQAMMSSDSESDMDLDGLKKDKTKKKEKKDPSKPAVRTKYDRMFERTNQDVLSSHYSKLVVSDPSSNPNPNAQGKEGEGEEDDDFLSVKRRLNDDDLDALAGTAPLPSGTKALSLGGPGSDPYIIDSKRREKALSSKKKMLKFMGTSSKLVFDDDGVPHEAYELVDEEGFRELGPAEEQRRKFVEEEGERVKVADERDKEAARVRKREKREKRRAREMAELGLGEEVQGPTVGGDGERDREDGLALLRSLPMAGGRMEQEVGEEEVESEEERPAKKAKKWFQVDTEEDRKEKKEKEKRKKGKGRVIEVDEEPETLEDLEALAAGLLD